MQQCRDGDSMIESGITSKGQTTLPKAVREALSIQAGDRIRYVIEGSEFCPCAPSTGCMAHSNTTVRLPRWRTWTVPLPTEVVRLDGPLNA